MPLWTLALALLSAGGWVSGQGIAATGSPPIMKSYRDAALGLTYRYSAEFVVTETPPAPGSGPVCVHAPLSAGSTDAGGSSAFVLSTIDAACPDILQQAQLLGAFTRTQLVHQLDRYGIPSVTHEPVLYLIAGHAIAVTTAAARATATQAGDVTTTTYAAKVCLQTDQVLSGKAKPGLLATPRGVPPLREILCFDFTTVDKNRLPAMLSFPIQFEGHEAQPLVSPGILQ